MDLEEMQSMGGHARAAKLTPEQRKKIAARAGKASGKARRKKARQKVVEQKINSHFVEKREES